MNAAPLATKEYCQKRFPKGSLHAHSILGSTGLTVSRVGFGGYRIHEFEPDHRQALADALLGGCNLIDTSSNYMDGSSERLVGEVTAELFRKNSLQREEIVFVTKGGYLQGEVLTEVKGRSQGKNAFPDMVEFQDDCWHNISPEFLDNQITRSLERLRIDCIDVFLLHNPEYHLKAGGQREGYYQKIEKSFRHLESEVKRGRIAWYGISSNTFPLPASRSDFTSLTRVIELAEGVARDHHFAVIQLPFNLFESGAALIKNNNGQTCFDITAEKQLGVLTNRPFNAFQQGRLVRLTSFPTHDVVEVKGELHTLLGRAIELEKKVSGLPKIPNGLQWAHTLREHLNELDDLLGWRDLLYQQILPSIRQATARLPRGQEDWSYEYGTTMQALLNLMTRNLESLAQTRSELLSESIVPMAPSLASSPTLSAKMIRLYQGLPQINTILIGMRKPSYVKDVLEGCSEPPLDPSATLQILTRMQRHRS